MTKEMMLAELAKCGYTMELRPRTDTDSTEVYFHSKWNREGSICKHTYSNEWTHDEIRVDCALSLLHWAGMQVVEKLDYV